LRTSGLRLESGSCVIMATLVPRHFFADATVASTRSSPTWISPAVNSPGAGINCMMARAVSDLPEPDSPTSPTLWPTFTEKEMERMTSPLPLLLGKATDRLSTTTTASVNKRGSTCSVGTTVDARSSHGDDHSLLGGVLQPVVVNDVVPNGVLDEVADVGARESRAHAEVQRHDGVVGEQLFVRRDVVRCGGCRIRETLGDEAVHTLVAVERVVLSTGDVSRARRERVEEVARVGKVRDPERQRHRRFVGRRGQGKERALLNRMHVDLDADGSKLLLERGVQVRPRLGVPAVHARREALRIAGLLQQCFRLLHVEWVDKIVLGVAGYARWDESRRGGALSVHVLQERRAVDGVRDGFTNERVVERLHLRVECQVVGVEAR